MFWEGSVMQYTAHYIAFPCPVVNWNPDPSLPIKLLGCLATVWGRWELDSVGRSGGGTSNRSVIYNSMGLRDGSKPSIGYCILKSLLPHVALTL